MNGAPNTPGPAGQRLVLINGVTWAVIVLFLAYGVFTQQSPPPSFSGRGASDSAAGGFLRVPGPATTAPAAADGSTGPSFAVHGMAGFGPRPSAPPPAKPDGEKKDGDKIIPSKDDKQKTPGDAPPPKIRIGGFAPAGQPKE